MEGGIPAVLVYEDLEHLSPYMHTTDDIVGLSLNSPELLEASARLATASVATLAGPFAEPRPRFVRGDANGDTFVDIADPISTLIYLFIGEPAPPCLKSLDADENGTIELTDAIRLLNYLFLGGTVPEPPYPECGTDPTEDTLTCLSHPPCD